MPGQKTSPHTSLENLPGGPDWPSPRHLAISLLSPGWVGGTLQAEHPRAHALCTSAQVQQGWACLQEPTDSMGLATSTWVWGLPAGMASPLS